MPERPTCTVFVGISVDGFMARPDGRFDFLPEDPEDHGFEAFMATVDALVMGRNTFEVVLPLQIVGTNAKASGSLVGVDYVRWKGKKE
jgi:hypothetical protein